MSYSNYTQVESAIRNFAPFTGNSCRGYWEDGEYVVISYNTKIAKATRAVVAGAIRRDIPGGLWVNSSKYSQTTTRLQNIIKRAWGVN
jgi:hypothetical protein